MDAHSSVARDGKKHRVPQEEGETETEREKDKEREEIKGEKR